MTSTQIEYFLSIAKNGSFSKTASHFFVTQPAVSTQISNLEKELQITLFERGSQGAKLTLAGRVLHDFFQKAAQDYRIAFERATALNSGKSRRFRIAIQDYISYEPIYHTVSKLTAAHPKVSVMPSTIPRDGLEQLIADKSFDILLYCGPLFTDHSTLTTQEICKLDVCINYSKFSRLARIPNLSIQDFADELFYIPQDSESGRQYFFDMLQRVFPLHGLPLPRTASFSESCYGYISSGAGCSFGVVGHYGTLPEQMDTSICRAFPTGLQTELIAAYKKHNSDPLVSEFLRELQYCDLEYRHTPQTTP